jgi:hypothetical protein
MLTDGLPEVLRELRADMCLHLRTHFACTRGAAEGHGTTLIAMLEQGIQAYEGLLKRLGCRAEEEPCTALLEVARLQPSGGDGAGRKGAAHHRYPLLFPESSAGACLLFVCMFLPPAAAFWGKVSMAPSSL